MKKKAINTLEKIKEIKDKRNLQIIDTHVHPLDVMGVVYYKDFINGYSDVDYKKPTLLERMKYGRFEKVATRAFFSLFPNMVEKIIKHDYSFVNLERIKKEMHNSLIDKTALLPLEPFVPTEFVGDLFFDNDKVIMLASIDVHNIEKENISKVLDSYIEKYKIVGIKLHPNFQNFKPIPEHNNNEIAEKLDKIYSCAEEKNLYLLFHSGLSFFTKKINKKYRDIHFRSMDNSLLEKFCEKNGESSLFENYNVKIVLAHLGHYGLPFYDLDRLEKVTSLYENVYFDTSGTSPKLIKKVLERIGSDRIIFGSDGLYNRMLYNLIFLYQGIQSADISESTESAFSKIASTNYLDHILKH